METALKGRLEHRLDEVVEYTRIRRHSHETDKRSRYRQQYERPQHERFRFVRVDIPGHVVFAEEDDEHQPEHIKRGQEGTRHEERAYKPVAPQEGVAYYLVFRPEARQRNHTSVCERCYQEGTVGGGHFVTELAHLADVLFAMHTMYDRAGSQK